MPIDYPDSPTLNETYTYLGKTWQWNGFAWDNITTTLGPQGTTGIQGFTGIQGLTGTQGFTGNQGTTGSGAQGTQGLQGFTGIQGPATINSVLTGVAETFTSVATGTTAGQAIIFDATTSTVQYYGVTTGSTAASGFTINVRGNATTTLNSLLAAGQAITFVFINRTGAVTTSFPTSFSIDGSAQTVQWVGGLAPNGGNASSTDVYTYSVFKIDNTPTYRVLAQVSRWA